MSAVLNVLNFHLNLDVFFPWPRWNTQFLLHLRGHTCWRLGTKDKTRKKGFKLNVFLTSIPGSESMVQGVVLSPVEKREDGNHVEVY